MAKGILSEFQELWNSKYALSFDEFYENYKEKYLVTPNKEIENWINTQ